MLSFYLQNFSPGCVLRVFLVVLRIQGFAKTRFARESKIFERIRDLQGFAWIRAFLQKRESNTMDSRIQILGFAWFECGHSQAQQGGFAWIRIMRQPRLIKANPDSRIRESWIRRIRESGIRKNAHFGFAWIRVGFAVRIPGFAELWIIISMGLSTLSN